MKCFLRVAFLFLQGQEGSRKIEQKRKYSSSPCIIPDLGGTPVLSEDGFVVGSRGGDYA